MRWSDVALPSTTSLSVSLAAPYIQYVRTYLEYSCGQKPQWQELMETRLVSLLLVAVCLAMYYT